MTWFLFWRGWRQGPVVIAPRGGSSVFSRAFVTKDPDSVEAFFIDWRQRLSALTIASSDFTVTGPDGALTASYAAVLSGNQQSQIVLSGGSIGRRYTVTNEIVTNESPAQTLKSSFRVRIEQE